MTFGDYITQYGYTVMCCLSIVVTVFFVGAYASKFSLSFKRGCLYALITYALCIAAVYVWKEIDRIMTGSGSLTSSKIVFLVPIFSVALSSFFGVSGMRSIDYYAPTFYLARGICKIGCLCQGCCLGREWSWGIYDPIIRGYAFPMPLFEAIGCFAIMGFAIIMNKRMNYCGNGRVYAYAMIIFGVFRYCIEFTSRSEIVVWLINESQIYAAVMLLCGLVGLYLIEKIEAKNNSYSIP